MISNTTESATIRRQRKITEVRIAKNPDNTLYWQAPVETIRTIDGTGEVLGQEAESLTVQHADMTARIAGLNAQLGAILAALEDEWNEQNPAP